MPIVKRITRPTPMPDGSFEDCKYSVNLTVSDSVFSIILPDHISNVVRTMGLPDYISINDVFTDDHKSVKHRLVTADDINQCVDRFAQIMRHYVVWVQDAKAVQYLMVTFKYNVDLPDAYDRHRNLSFAPTPSFGLITKIRWKIGDDFFEKSPRGSWLQDRHCEHKNAGVYLILWTQERHDYLLRAEKGISDMILKLLDFFGDLENNMDCAIENHSNILKIEDKKS